MHSHVRLLVGLFSLLTSFAYSMDPSDVIDMDEADTVEMSYDDVVVPQSNNYNNNNLDDAASNEIIPYSVIETGERPYASGIETDSPRIDLPPAETSSRKKLTRSSSLPKGLSESSVRSNPGRRKNVESLELSDGAIVQVDKKQYEDLKKLNERLHQLVKEGNTGRIKGLLRAGANIESINAHGDTPLKHAVRSQSTTMVEFLLKMGANVNGSVDGGETPLHLAARLGYVKFVKLLLDKGANPNATDKYGHTPLYGSAFAQQNQKIADLLIKAGADLAIKDTKGMNVVEYARELGKQDFADFLEDRLQDSYLVY